MSKSLSISALIVVLAVLCGLLLPSHGSLAAVGSGAPLLAMVLLWGTREVSSAAARLRAAGTLFLLLIVAVPWQDTVTTALGAANISNSTEKYKLAVTGLAVLAAATCRLSGMKRFSVTGLLIAYAVTSALGGMAGPDPQSSVLRSARMVAVVLAVGWTAQRFDPRELASLFARFAFWISGLSLGAFLVGLMPRTSGRLGGYLLPLHPNVLGFLAGLGLICLLVLRAYGQLPGSRLAYSAPVLGVTLALTGSRTSLGAFSLSLVVLLAPRARDRGGRILLLAVLSVFVAALLQTNTTIRPLGNLVTRSGNSPVASTLNGRFTEFNAAKAANNTARTELFGRGLAAKSVAVKLPYTSIAPVDGSWFAAYLSAGALGVLLLALAVLDSIYLAIRAQSGITLAVLAFVLISSVSGTLLDDVSAGMVVLVAFVVSLECAADPRVLMARDGKLSSQLRPLTGLSKDVAVHSPLRT